MFRCGRSRTRPCRTAMLPMGLAAPTTGPVGTGSATNGHGVMARDIPPIVAGLSGGMRA
jgi:hypothetical protein